MPQKKSAMTSFHPILIGFPIANFFPVLDTFLAADPIGKAIVVVLVGASVAVWTIMFAKHSELRQANRADRIFSSAFRQQSNPLELLVRGISHPHSHQARVYVAVCNAAKLEFSRQAQKDGRHPREIDLSAARLSARQLEAIRTLAKSEASEEIIRMQEKMVLLGSTYTVAPMMGLFGTVWGVMVAFQAMGEHGSANIAAVAPGIASAMLTTVIGLVVAIPSAIGSNSLNEKISLLAVRLENFADLLADRLQQAFLGE